MDRKIDEANTKTGTDFERLLTEKDVADLLQVSQSWLAKARMGGYGPPYVMVGRSCGQKLKL